jgi:large subunit ribosomal protein L24e
MSGNTAKNMRQAALDVERHIELVQPRTLPATTAPDVRDKVREKISVRAAGKKEMAKQMARAGGNKKARESRLIPADGAGMGMSMNVD